MSSVAQRDWEAFQRDPCEATFCPFYRQTKALVWSLCLRILRNEEDASDAFQSAYCRLLALARDPELRNPDDPPDARQLLYRVTVREANNLRMRRRRRAEKEVAVEELPITPAAMPGADDLASLAQIRESIARIVDTLPESYRVPVLLHYFDGLTHREVALAMGKPVSTISNRIATAHRRLERKMKRAGLAGVAALLALAGAEAAPLIEPPASMTADSVYEMALSTILAGEKGALAEAGAEQGSRFGIIWNSKTASVLTLSLLVIIATFITLRDLPAVTSYIYGLRSAPSADVSPPPQNGGDFVYDTSCGG